jgi:transposase
MNFDFSQIKSHFDGKAGLIAGLCQEINLHTIIDDHLSKKAGRPTDYPYGSLAQMLLINIADDHHPLSRLDEYFENVDLESLLGHSINLKKLNDDRFGSFLDAMHDAGCEQIYSDIAFSAFKRYGITISNMNFDTTSKVMWGEYQTEDGTEGLVEITFGYSKQKRFDKKQVKFSLGTTNGICFDGQVLSGNLDDKTYNIQNIERAKKIKDRFTLEGEDFFYIADSAAFTKECLKKAQALSVDVITRMTDNLIAVKDTFEYVLDHMDALEIVEVEIAKKTPSVYRIHESTCNYHDTDLKMVTCYSEQLKPQKERTLEKRVFKEQATLQKQSNALAKRIFACEEDAVLEIDRFQKKELSKLKYHNVKLAIETKETRRRGRPSKDPSKNQVGIQFFVTMDIVADQNRIERQLNKECLFTVASTKLTMSGADILKEYKTQSAVERKFQFMKSSQFIDSFYLDSPKRIEALGYLLLLLMLLLSVAEFVVRRELARDKKIIIGPGKKVMARPSMIAIYRVFYSVATASVVIGNTRQRGLSKPLKDNVSTILRYLGIPENIYYRGSS